MPHTYKELLFASKSLNSRGALKCNKVENKVKNNASHVLTGSSLRTSVTLSFPDKNEHPIQFTKTQH